MSDGFSASFTRASEQGSAAVGPACIARLVRESFCQGLGAHGCLAENRRRKAICGFWQLHWSVPRRFWRRARRARRRRARRRVRRRLPRSDGGRQRNDARAQNYGLPTSRIPLRIGIGPLCCAQQNPGVFPVDFAKIAKIKKSSVPQFVIPAAHTHTV